MSELINPLSVLLDTFPTFEAYLLECSVPWSVGVGQGLSNTFPIHLKPILLECSTCPTRCP